jgi:hypothetical protein
MKRRRVATAGAIRQTPVPVTHSAVQFFNQPRVLTTFERGYTEEVFSMAALTGPTLDFQLSGERNIYVDLNNIYLHVDVSLLALDRTGALGQYKEITDEGVDPAVLVNNSLHSIFSNCEVSLQGEVIGTSNNLYGHKAFIETELSHPSECKETWLACQGYEYEVDPGNAADPSFASRRLKNKAKTWNSFYGRLAVDFFSANKYLIPGVELRIRLTRALAEFCVYVTKATVKADWRYQVRIDAASLFVHKIEVAPEEYAWLERSLSSRPAIYEYQEIIAKTYLVAKGHNAMIEEDIFNAAPIRRLVVAMNKIPQITGTLDSNPYHYQKFDLSRVLLYREGQSVGSTPLILENNTRAYFNTVKALQAQHAGNGIKLVDYANHFILVFVLTADLEAHDDTTRPELTGGRLRLHLEFKNPLPDTIEVLILGERKSVVYIDKNRKVLKNTLFTT